MKQITFYMSVLLIAAAATVLPATESTAQVHFPAGDTDIARPSNASGSFTMDAKGKRIASYTASNGRTYKVGDTITVGSASHYGSFGCILTAFSMRYDGDNGEPLSRKWEGSRLAIKGMDNGMKYYKNSSAPHPMYFFIEIKGLFGGLYQINVEDALNAKEMQ